MLQPGVGRDVVPWESYPECPDCGANAWRLGPRGGLSVNIECTRCGEAFNAVLALQLIQRITGGAQEYDVTRCHYCGQPTGSRYHLMHCPLGKGPDHAT
jgi:hypothetical protein